MSLKRLARTVDKSPGDTSRIRHHGCISVRDLRRRRRARVGSDPSGDLRIILVVLSLCACSLDSVGAGHVLSCSGCSRGSRSVSPTRSRRPIVRGIPTESQLPPHPYQPRIASAHSRLRPLGTPPQSDWPALPSRTPQHQLPRCLTSPRSACRTSGAAEDVREEHGGDGAAPEVVWATVARTCTPRRGF